MLKAIIVDDEAPARSELMFLLDELGQTEVVAEASNVFAEKEGYVAIEAEHYYSKVDAQDAQWTVIPFLGRTLSGISLRPYTKPVEGAALNYRFTTTNNIQRVMVVVKSTLDFLNQGGLRYRVTLDDGQPQVVNFNHNLNEAPENIYSIYYPTVARRVVESTVPLTAAPGNHTLRIEPLDPAIVFENVVVDCGGYQPSYLHGQESPRKQE